jgi:hypothetical protein
VTEAAICEVSDNRKYSSATVFTGNTFQDLLRLREIADNTERYIKDDQNVSVHPMITVQKHAKIF